MSLPDDDASASRLELAFDPRRNRSDQPAGHRTEPPPDHEDGQSGTGVPGDPRTMSGALRRALRPLLEGTYLEIKQRKEWGEVLTGWEARNRYHVRGGEGHTLVEAEEEGHGWLDAVMRNLNPFRKISLECVTDNGIVALRLARPWTFWLTRADVYAWDQRVMGVLVQRFTWLRRVLEIQSTGGEVLARIEGPFFRPWTFLVQKDGLEVGAIRKRWGGVGRELWTDADTFTLELRPTLTCPRVRQMLLAATLLIDLTWFENGRRGQRHGVMGLLGSR